MLEELAEQEEESKMTPVTPIGDESSEFTHEDNTYEDLVSYLSNSM
jgi:hypothetical protein